MELQKIMRIGIVGAGFSGTAVAALLHRLSDQPLEIILFEKTGKFGTGDAYGTPFPFHLLNVLAKDMSAFEEEPAHFVNWIHANPEVMAYLDATQTVDDQFVPRMLYHRYLNDLIAAIQADSKKNIKLTLESSEVVDVQCVNDIATLILHDDRSVQVDRVVLALGNNQPTFFPFPVSDDVNCIANSWDYTALTKIPVDDPVLIVGSGLSMVDAVLTLHNHQHKGPIYAVSRHGLLPLPHAFKHESFAIDQADLPDDIRPLTKALREQIKLHSESGGDWRTVINALRKQLPLLWSRLSLHNKKRFVRHVLSYWNIHRHRIHVKIADILTSLQASKQLMVLSGRVLGVQNKVASIKLRHLHKIKEIPATWLINCMGPPLSIASMQPLIRSLLKQQTALLDNMQMGFAVSASGALKEPTGTLSASLYALGPITKGENWECSAVPEIRKQCLDLVREILCSK